MVWRFKWRASPDRVTCALGNAPVGHFVPREKPDAVVVDILEE